MGKQVPLVIYRNGVRTQIGMASVGEDGSIEAQVSKDHWPTIKPLIQPDVGQLSITPAPAKVKVHPSTPNEVRTIHGHAPLGDGVTEKGI